MLWQVLFWGHSFNWMKSCSKKFTWRIKCRAEYYGSIAIHGHVAYRTEYIYIFRDTAVAGENAGHRQVKKLIRPSSRVHIQVKFSFGTIVHEFPKLTLSKCQMFFFIVCPQSKLCPSCRFMFVVSDCPLHFALEQDAFFLPSLFPGFGTQPANSVH